MTGQLPTPDTIAAVREAGLHGASCTAIAKTLHVSRTAVTKILDESGIARTHFNQPRVHTIQPIEWMARALCAQTDPDMFTLGKGGDARPARAICARCPVTADCLAYALATHQRGGIWGGLTDGERRRLGRAAA